VSPLHQPHRLLLGGNGELHLESRRVARANETERCRIEGDDALVGLRVVRRRAATRECSRGDERQ
jgi:hypothetical protein